VFACDVVCCGTRGGASPTVLLRFEGVAAGVFFAFAAWDLIDHLDVVGVAHLVGGVVDAVYYVAAHAG